MAKTDPRLNVTRTPRTDDEKELLRALKELRQSADGVLYTGSRKNTVKIDGNEVAVTRYVIEVDDHTARLILATLSGKATKPTTRKPRTRAQSGREVKFEDGAKLGVTTTATRKKAAAK